MPTENKLKIGTIVAACLAGAGAVAALYYFWKKEENRQQDNKDDTAQNNSTVASLPNQSQTQTQTTAVPDRLTEQFVQATQKKEVQVKNPETQNVTQTLKDSIDATLSGKGPNYQEILQKVKVRVDQERNNKHLSMQLIILMHDALVEYSYKSFGELVIANRSQRRVFMKTDLSQYETIVKTGTEELEQLVQRDVFQVLDDCGVTQLKYEESNNYWAQINPQFALISLLVIDKMKLMIPSNKTSADVDMAKVLKIIDFQLEKYPTVKVNCAYPELTAMVKQSLLSDMVFEQFDLEEEDYIKVPGLESNREFGQKAQQLQMMIQMESMQGGMMGGMGF